MTAPPRPTGRARFGSRSECRAARGICSTTSGNRFRRTTPAAGIPAIACLSVRRTVQPSSPQEPRSSPLTGSLRSRPTRLGTTEPTCPPVFSSPAKSSSPLVRRFPPPVGLREHPRVKKRPPFQVAATRSAVLQSVTTIHSAAKRSGTPVARRWRSTSAARRRRATTTVRMPSRSSLEPRNSRPSTRPTTDQNSPATATKALEPPSVRTSGSR